MMCNVSKLISDFRMGKKKTVEHITNSRYKLVRRIPLMFSFIPTLKQNSSLVLQAKIGLLIQNKLQKC